MLGDNTEKSKNPLKKAMRRRNAKTVQFTAPTYYEPSEANYSSDEEEGDESQMEVDQEPANEDPEASRDPAEITTAQTQGAANGLQRSTSHESLTEEPQSPDKAQAPDSSGMLSVQDPVSRSRKGVVRNTDSFFKDDTAETKKISLTPRLLRGDSDAAGHTEQDTRQRPSLETFDKMVGVEEKPGKEEKKKEKKGMLSGLFKRKDKAPKGQKVDDRSDNKLSEESLRPSVNSKESLDSVHKVDPVVERRPSKLQKQPPVISSPKASPTEGRYSQIPAALQPSREEPVQSQTTTSPPAPTGPAPPPPTVRQVQNESSQESLQPPQESAARLQPNAHLPNRFPSLQEKRQPEPEPRQEPEPVVKPIYTQQAKQRFALDTSDSDDDQTPTQQQPERDSVSPLNASQSHHQRNDSGMQISPIETPQGFGSYPQTSKRAQEADDSPYPEQEITPIEADGTASTSKASPSTATTHTPSTSRSEPSWSDASLRTYLDNDQDIKDLLIIVHDKSNVTPVGPDHPLMTNLFSNERSKLTEMQTQLDSMLMGWMSRRNTGLLSR
jgi:hypothetical protein